MYHVSAQGIDERMIKCTLLLLLLNWHHFANELIEDVRIPQEVDNTLNTS